MDTIAQELYSLIVEKIENNNGILTTKELDKIMDTNPLFDIKKSLHSVTKELDKVYTNKQMRDENGKFIGCRYAKKEVL